MQEEVIRMLGKILRVMESDLAWGRRWGTCVACPSKGAQVGPRKLGPGTPGGWLACGQKRLQIV